MSDEKSEIRREEVVEGTPSWHFPRTFWTGNAAELCERAAYYGTFIALRTYLIRVVGLDDVQAGVVAGLFGGEAYPEVALTHPEARQVDERGDPVPAACPHAPATRKLLERWARTAASLGPDLIFWDEPHYALPKSYASITGGAGDDWSCRCPYCRRMFEEHYGYEMP